MQEEQIRALATLSVRLMSFGVRRLQERLPELLEPGECVRALAFATRGGRWWQELRAANSLIVAATDRRLLLARVFTASSLLERAAQPPVESVPYTDVHSVEEHPGRLESKLTLMTASGPVRLTSMRARWASALAAVIQERLSERSGSEVS
jgi:prophage DNA circulation protein